MRQAPPLPAALQGIVPVFIIRDFQLAISYRFEFFIKLLWILGITTTFYFISRLAASGMIVTARSELAAIAKVFVNARGRNSLKRGGGAGALTLHSGIEGTPGEQAFGPIDILAIDDALTKLAGQDPESALLVELRYFGGMTIDQAADHLSIGRNTAARRWRAARAWLRRELGSGTPTTRDDDERGAGEG